MYWQLLTACLLLLENRLRNSEAKNHSYSYSYYSYGKSNVRSMDFYFVPAGANLEPTGFEIAPVHVVSWKTNSTALKVGFL